MCQRLKFTRPKILLLGGEGVGKTGKSEYLSIIIWCVSH